MLALACKRLTEPCETHSCHKYLELTLKSARKYYRTNHKHHQVHMNGASFLPITDTPLSRRIRRVRQTIWSSVLYRRAHQNDLTRPFRRFEINLIFRQDLTGPVKLIQPKCRDRHREPQRTTSSRRAPLVDAFAQTRQ